jgi:hypothetical protein
VGIVLSTLAFELLGGKANARMGAIFGLMASPLGWCASRWPQLSRAIELNGGLFIGPFIATLLTAAFAITLLVVAAILASVEFRRYARRLCFALVAVWTIPTITTEYVLSRWWGFGSASLNQAAGIETQKQLETYAVVRLSNTKTNQSVIERVDIEAPGLFLSPGNLLKLGKFLNQVNYRHIFARQALSLVRRGWLLWWDCDRALDALSLSIPDRVYPDYRSALDLIKVGPLTIARYEKLEKLARAAMESPRGFEDVTTSQYIFEGFAACYARFGEEARARRWLSRIDNLLMVSDKKVEIAALEDFREGRVSGSLLIEGRPATEVIVGLFQIWRTTSTAAGQRLLSASTFPDEKGRFIFSDLGPGEYELALLGRLSDLSGQVWGSPGHFDIDYDRAEIRLPPIRLTRTFDRSAFDRPLRPIQNSVKKVSPPLIWRK